MTDRELLELAARAAGYGIPSSDDHDEIGRQYEHHLGLWVKRTWGWGWFLPHIDDGDALRLMVHLAFGIYRGHDPIRGEFVEVFYRPRKYARQKSCIEYHQDHQDQFAATRRAIVRAAAEIGKAQQ